MVSLTLHRRVGLTFNKSGTKEKTYAMKDYGELGWIVIHFWQNLEINKKEATLEQCKNKASKPEAY